MKWTKRKRETRYYGGIYSAHHKGYLLFADSPTLEGCKKKAESNLRYFEKASYEGLEIRYTKEEKTIYELA